jgi:hypothetical protein
MGAGIYWTIFTFLGGITGAFLYGHFESDIQLHFPKWQLPANKYTLDKLLNTSYHKVSIPIVVVLLSFVGNFYW